MTMPSKIILKCNKCKKLIAVSLAKWETLLKRWGTVYHVEQNYICKKCYLPRWAAPDYEEIPSPEEVELLSQTIDGKPFNTTAVVNFLGKISVLKKLWKHAKVLVVKETDLQKFHSMYKEKIQKGEEKND